MARTYENFDVELLHEGDRYTTRARSPRGEASAAFSMPLSPLEVRVLALSIARGRKASRSVQPREVDEIKSYGERLFNALFTGDVLACYHESLVQVRGSDSTGLRVRLRLSGVPELALVPWEYLYDRRSGRFLALQDETPIVRYLDLPLHGGTLEIRPPLRVLVMISGPADLPGLDTDEEWRRLNEALGDLITAGAVRLDRLEKATVKELRWQLKAEDYHVFHFIGHGGVDAITDRGILILENPSGRSDAVEAEVLAGILSSEKTLRLVVLNACEGGRASKGDIFAGTAQALVQQDLPAVIAMQFEITDDAAIALTHDFYKALAFGDPVDAALTEARRGLRFERRNELEWGTPVLYMRANDGRLFDVKGTPIAAPPAPAVVPPPGPRSPGPGIPAVAASQAQSRKVADLMHESQLAANAERWSDAADKLEAVLQLDPSSEEATERLAAVRREETLAALFRTGADHETAGRLDAAVDSFQRVRKEAGTDYHGVDARIGGLREAIEGIEAKRKERAARRKVWIRVLQFVGGLCLAGVIVGGSFAWRSLRGRTKAEYQPPMATVAPVDSPMATVAPVDPPMATAAPVDAGPDAIATYLEEQVDDPVQLISHVPPRYPKALQQAGVSGYVEATWVVDTLGHAEPLSWTVIGITNAQFEAPARETITKALYRPARIQGRAVRQLVRQKITFGISP